MTLKPGSRLGRYQIVAPLGAGGMGIVYTALDTTLDRPVALKFLPPGLTSDDDARRRFVQEAKAASALDHPNVCTIHEINETADGRQYLVMAHYEGETLKQRIAGGPLPVQEAVDVARQVAEGLAAAHAAGIVHRDIKPANIVVTRDGTAKILDFGIAKLTGVTGLTETGVTLGTVAYMSPEQVNGQEARPQSDVWALGAVLYEMLTGQPPFRGDRPAVVLHAITGSAPTPVQELSPETPPGVVQVVTRALEKSRSRRYATARDLLAALPVAPTATWPEDDETGSTSITTGMPLTASEVPSIAVLPFVNMSADTEQQYFCEGLAQDLIDALARLDGLRVVARSSAFQFQGKGHDLREVGETLKVKTVLEGSVRRAGNRLRITAELINVSDGYHLWTNRYDRELDDIFAVQDEIVRAVVTELRVRLLGAPDAPLVVRPTDSMEAHACYMLAGHHRFGRNEPVEAGRLYAEATRHDPNFAAAWAGVAHTAIMGGYVGLLAPAAVSDSTRTSVERALRLDERLATAHDARARIHFWLDWDWEAAERGYKHTIDLEPGGVEGHISFASFLALRGRTDEALAQLSKAQELDPLSVYAVTVEGMALLYGRQFEAASAACRRALELEPRAAISRWHLGLCLQQLSEPDAAVACLDGMPSRTARSPAHQAFLGHALAAAGKHAGARTVLTKLVDRRDSEYVAPFTVAMLNLSLGEQEEALDWLQLAYEERSPLLPMLTRVDWDPVQDHPRFRSLCDLIGVPDLRPLGT